MAADKYPVVCVDKKRELHISAPAGPAGRDKKELQKNISALEGRCGTSCVYGISANGKTREKSALIQSMIGSVSGTMISGMIGTGIAAKASAVALPLAAMTEGKKGVKAVKEVYGESRKTVIKRLKRQKSEMERKKRSCL